MPAPDAMNVADAEGLRRAFGLDFHQTTASTDDLLRELIVEVRGLRTDLKIAELRTGKRLIGQ